MDANGFALTSDTNRLNEIRLWAVRVTWFVMTTMIAILVIVGFPLRVAELRHLCEAPPCESGQLAAEGVAVLESVGLSLETFVSFDLGLESLILAIYVPVAVFMIWRGSKDWMAIFASLTLILFVGTSTIVAAVNEAGLVWRILAAIPLTAGNWATFTLMYLFPNGRFEPRWTRWLALAWLPLLAAGAIVEPGGNGPIGLGSLVLGLATGFAAQAYRYRRVSSAVERQQTKWAVFGFALVSGGFILVIVPNFLFPAINVIEAPITTAPQLMYIGIALPFAYLGIYALPITIAFSILRYRLWDIDFIIRRTVTYGLVTAILVGLYVGSIAFLQSLIIRLTGGESPVVLVVSTLAIVALFTPIRRRVQGWIEQRFNRTHYDAARILRTFGDVTRDEVDLEKLETALLKVVGETMQPTHASLWVHDPAGSDAHLSV